MVYRVFVSSTFEDLIRHRQAVTNQLRQMNWQTVDVVGGRAPQEDLLNFSLRALSEADVFVGIYAARYGVRLPGHDTSLDEQLYEAARQRGLPCYVYLVAPGAEWAADYLQTRYPSALWRMFLDRLQADHPDLRTFDTPAELAQHVELDLTAFAATARATPPQRRHVLLGAVIVLSIVALIVLFVSPIT
ncbi:MAG: DUF4062 domain-containing protein [Anaerolineales bacterium]